MDFKSSIYQTLFAAFLVVTLYVITLQILNLDSLVIFPKYSVKSQQSTLILKGPVNSAEAGTSFNTIVPFDANRFMSMPKSLNRGTGSQFTYQFWLKVDSTDFRKFEDLVILMKGDNRLYKVAYYDIKQNEQTKTHAQITSESNESAKYMIKCPLIKFKNSYKNMTVEFNTNNHPDVAIDIDLTQGTMEQKRKNLLSILPREMVMLTFTFQDNFSVTEGFENGIKFTMYVNDIAYVSHTASTMPILKNNFLKLNDGDLHILPNLPNKEKILTLANVKYYNYAMTDGDVRASYKKGMSESGNPAHLMFT